MANQAVNTILNTRYQAQPLTVDLSEANANLRQQKAMAWQDAENKRKEKIQVLDELGKLAAAGLPKQFQEELNYDIDNFLKAAGEGKFGYDPATNPEFRMELGKLAGKGKSMEEQAQARIKAIAEDGTVYKFDELGSYDATEEVMSSMMSPWKKGYDPNGKDNFEVASIDFYENFDKKHKDLEYDLAGNEKFKTNFLEQHGVESITTAPSDTEGFITSLTTTSIPKEKQDAFINNYKHNNQAVLTQQFAKLRKIGKTGGLTLDEWSTQRAIEEMPAIRGEAKLVENKIAIDAAKDRKDKVYTVTESPYDATTAKQAVGNDETLKKEINSIGKEFGLTRDNSKFYSIGKGEKAQPIDFGGQLAYPSYVVMANDKNYGFAVLSIPTTVSNTSSGYETEGGDTPSTNAKTVTLEKYSTTSSNTKLRKVVVKITPAEFETLQARLGVNIRKSNSQQQETNSDDSKSLSRGTIKGLVGKKGYEGYTESELIEYYKSQGYNITQ